MAPALGAFLVGDSSLVILILSVSCFMFPSYSPPMPKSATALLAILLAVTLWGAMPFLIDHAAKELAATHLTLLRLFLPGIILLLGIGPRQLGRALRQNIRLFLVLSFVGFALPQLFYVYALQSKVPVPTVTFIACSYPALSLLLAVIVLKERPTRLHGLAMAGAILGLYLLTGPELALGFSAAIGIFWAFLSAFGWATSGIAGKFMTSKIPPLTIVANRHLLGGTLMLPLLFFEKPLTAAPGSSTVLAVVALVGMSIVSYYAYYRGLAKTTVATASLLESFQPVITLLVGLLLGKPGLSPIQLAGAALVLVGGLLVTLIELTRRPKAAGPEAGLPPV
jgi:drug/metabolite transporter (DMT)-like permease